MELQTASESFYPSTLKPLELGKVRLLGPEVFSVVSISVWVSESLLICLTEKNEKNDLPVF
jgi:hypothetical protein